MNGRIKAIYPYNGHIANADIFGYSSKGIPGIEIVGPGKNNRFLKEKLIYLSKIMNLKLPLQRYVICIEGDAKKISDHNSQNWLELPLLILFLYLTKQISIHKLDDCLASGTISINGIIRPLNFKEYIDSYDQKKRKKLKFLAPSSYHFPEYIRHIPLENILQKQLNHLFIVDC